MPQENDNPPPAPAVIPPPVATGVTQDQLHQAIEKARTEERTKLRGEIETAQNASKADAAKVVELTKEVARLTTELQTIQASLRPEGGVDVAKVIEQTVTRSNEAWAEKYQALEAKVQAVESDRQRLTIEQTRARLIQAHGGEAVLIPSLVTGSNEAELLASIDRSKAEFNRIRQIVGGTQTPPSQQPGHGQGSSGTPPSLPAVPAGGGAAAGGQPQADISARKMSREEYAKNRGNLKAAAVARYPTNVITQR